MSYPPASFVSSPARPSARVVIDGTGQSYKPLDKGNMQEQNGQPTCVLGVPAMEFCPIHQSPSVDIEKPGNMEIPKQTQEANQLLHLYW